MYSQHFLNWIKPLTYYPEYQILTNHTSQSNKQIRIKKREEVLKKYNLTYRKLYKITWKLEFLTHIYELLVAAGLI